MQVVAVDMGHIAGQFARQHTGLSEPAPAVGCAVAREVGVEGGACLDIRRLRLGPAATLGHASGVILQIFRQIKDIGRDLAMQVMRRRVGRVAQRHDELIDAAPLETEDFLRDEGLRQARITFDDDGEAGHRL